MSEDLTALYRVSYSRLSSKDDEVGLFYSEPLPPLSRVPLFTGGRQPIAAWLRDHEAMSNSGMSEKQQRHAMQMIRTDRKWLAPDEGLSVRWTDRGRKVAGYMLKANPKFELVVINRHDRGALLKLLAEIDTTTNVERWLAARTRRSGASAPSDLHAHYATWCEQERETPTGIKGFAQALVTAGVKKLPRRAGSARYELELR